MRTTTAIALLIAGLSVSASASSMHPIVKDGQLFGATASGQWVTAGEAAKHLKGGERYKVYGHSTQIGSGIGSKPSKADDHCPDVPQVDIKGGPTDSVVAIDAPWNATPRKSHVLSDYGVPSVKVVAAYLKSKGVHDPKVDPTQIISCDLDGKGSASTIVTAKYAVSGTEFYVVLLDRSVHGKYVTIPLLGDVAHKVDPSRYPIDCSVKGVYDFKGDGKMEILIDAKYQDSAMSYIYAVKGSKAKAVLTTGCGA